MGKEWTNRLKARNPQNSKLEGHCQLENCICKPDSYKGMLQELKNQKGDRKCLFSVWTWLEFVKLSPVFTGDICAFHKPCSRLSANPVISSQNDLEEVDGMKHEKREERWTEVSTFVLSMDSSNDHIIGTEKTLTFFQKNTQSTLLKGMLSANGFKKNSECSTS